jgi:hypothetical protein
MSGKKSTWLVECNNNVYSQLGEDGVIGAILEIIPGKDRWCVEFGAWDGKYLSNVANLILNQSFSAVLIEANKEKFKELKHNYADFKNVYVRNQVVGFSGNDNLDTILQETPIPINFDFLSIDIDGNDYHVWKAIIKYKPKSLCIEYNHTIPTEIEFIQDADPHKNQGSSLLSLAMLGKEMGYELVSVLTCNAFFVKKEYFPLFSITDNSPQVLRTDLHTVTYLFSGFDGHVFLRGYNKLALHAIELHESKLQPLPKFLQKMRDQYGVLELAIYCVLLFLRNPSYFWIKLRERISRRK